MKYNEQINWLTANGFSESSYKYQLIYSKQLTVDTSEFEDSRELHFIFYDELHGWKISLHDNVHYHSIALICNIPFDEDFNKFNCLIDLIV